MGNFLLRRKIQFARNNAGWWTSPGAPIKYT